MMFVFTVKASVTQEIADKWFNYMTTKHIRDVLNTRCFEKAELEKILDTGDEVAKFVARYYFNSMVDYNEYVTKFAPTLRAEHNELFGNSVIAERTISELREYQII